MNALTAPGILFVPQISAAENVAAIIKKCCEYYDVTEKQIRGKDRHRPIAQARMMAMYLIREYTRYTLKATAAEFGGRDHTTAGHACEVVNRLMEVYEDVKRDVAAISSGIHDSRPIRKEEIEHVKYSRDRPHQPIERPKAEYSNLRTYAQAF